MNAPFGKSEEEEKNGVKCDVASTGTDAFGTTSWNLYVGGRLYGTIPPKYLYDDDVMADLAIKIGPFLQGQIDKTNARIDKAASSNADSDDEYWNILEAVEREGIERDNQLQGQIDETTARIKKTDAKRKKNDRKVGKILMDHAQALKTTGKRAGVIEANQEELWELAKNMEKRLAAVEQEESD